MDFFMNSKKSMCGQKFRLMSAYQKMNANGREALDRLVGQLAKVDRVNSEVFFDPGEDRKRPKRRD